MRGFTAEIKGCYNEKNANMINICTDCPHSEDECECEDFRGEEGMDLLYTMKIVGDGFD